MDTLNISDILQRQFQKNSPFAFPKSASLPFKVIIPPFKEHFHLFLARATLSN